MFSNLALLRNTVPEPTEPSIFTQKGPPTYHGQHNGLGYYVRNAALYVDYCSNYFSMILIFIMSLNRCLHFVALKLCEFLFAGKRVFLPALLAMVSAVLTSYLVIETSRVKREYSSRVHSYVDIGSPDGWMTAMSIIGEVIPNFDIYLHKDLVGSIPV
ncbi:unnamed protein product [Caenorhabditis brenneri]